MSQTTSYTIATIVDQSPDEAIERVTALLKEEGFGVLTTIDVSATLKAKLDVDTPPYTILGACNPQLAYEGLQREPELGVMLPCNVIVYERDGRTHVAAMEPVQALAVVGNDQLADIASDAKERLQRVIERMERA